MNCCAEEARRIRVLDNPRTMPRCPALQWINMPTAATTGAATSTHSYCPLILAHEHGERAPHEKLKMNRAGLLVVYAF